MDVDFFYLLDSGGQPPFREMLPHFVQKADAIVLMVKLNETLDFKPTIRYREKKDKEKENEKEKEDIGYESELTNEEILHQYVQGVQSESFLWVLIWMKRRRVRIRARQQKGRILS